MRGEGFQLGEGHGVVLHLGIAEFDAAEAGLGECGLDLHERPWRRWWRSASLEPARTNIFVHVGDVFFAGVFEAGLVAEIVVAVGEAESADVDLGDHVGGVVQVLLG